MKRFLRPLGVAVAAAALLAGCGGSDPGVPDPVVVVPPPPVSNTVPASALVSAAAYTAFAATLQSSATALPLDVTGVVPPTTETGLPQAL